LFHVSSILARVNNSYERLLQNASYCTDCSADKGIDNEMIYKKMKLSNPTDQEKQPKRKGPHKMSVGNKRSFSSGSKVMQGLGNKLLKPRQGPNPVDIWKSLEKKPCCTKNCMMSHCWNESEGIFSLDYFARVFKESRARTSSMNEVELSMWLTTNFKTQSTVDDSTGAGKFRYHFQVTDHEKKKLDVCRNAWGIMHNVTMYALDSMAKAVKANAEILSYRKERAFTEQTIIPATYDEIDFIFKRNLGDGYGKYAFVYEFYLILLVAS